MKTLFGILIILIILLAYLQNAYYKHKQIIETQQETINQLVIERSAIVSYCSELERILIELERRGKTI